MAIFLGRYKHKRVDSSAGFFVKLVRTLGRVFPRSAAAKPVRSSFQLAEHSRSNFTRNIAIFGLVVGGVMIFDQIGSNAYYWGMEVSAYRYFLFNFLGIETIVPYLGSSQMGTFYLPSPTAVLATVYASIGYVCLWLSSRLDSPDKGDKPWTSPYIVTGFWFSMVALVFVVIMNWRNELYGEGKIESFLGFVLLLPLLAAALPGMVLHFLYVGASLGIFLAGIICIPRIFYVMTKTQQLQKAWQKGKDQVTFHAPDVAEALGVPAESVTVARKLRKDAAALKAEVQAAAEKVRRQEAELAKSMTDDAERFRHEAETSKLMAEIEERKIRIEELKRLKWENPNG